MEKTLFQFINPNHKKKHKKIIKEKILKTDFFSLLATHNIGNTLACQNFCFPPKCAVIQQPQPQRLDHQQGADSLLQSTEHNRTPRHLPFSPMCHNPIASATAIGPPAGAAVYAGKTVPRNQRNIVAYQNICFYTNVP